MLKPSGNGGTWVAIHQAETSAGIIMLSKIVYPKDSAQQSIFIVQGKDYYFYYLTTFETKARKRFVNFCQMIEYILEHKGYTEMKKFVKSYVLSNLGVWGGK